MKKIIFTLDTTATYFAQWLSDFTESIHVREFPVEYPEPQYPAESKGCYVLHAVPPLDHDVGGQTVVLDINCLYMVETEKGTIAYPGFWAIRFKIVPFARDQTKVTAECNNPAVMGYFKELLKEIAWLFPKSREAIEAKIGRLTSQQAQTEPPSPTADGMGDEEAEALSLPDWLPKKAETRKKWKKMYSSWLEMKKEYRERRDEWGDTDDPEPSLNDFRDRIISDLGWKYSTRWLQEIVKAGEANHLK